MKTTLQIQYKSKSAGLIDHDSERMLGRFEWLTEFRLAYREFIEATMPDERQRSVKFDATNDLPPVLVDYLPAAYAEKLLKQVFQTKTGDPVHRTTTAWLSLLGNRGMGSFQFSPSGLPELDAVEPVDIDKLHHTLRLLMTGAPQSISLKSKREVLRSGLFARGISPKALLDFNDFTGEVLSGQGVLYEGFEPWLLKWDGLDDDSTRRLTLEYEFQLLAGKCGLRTAACRRLSEGMYRHLMIRRFDKNPKTEAMYLSYAAWIEQDGSAWSDVFRRMRLLHMPHSEMEELFRRLTFITLTHNTGIDASRIVFVYIKQNGWSLAPAFNLKPAKSGKSTINLLNADTKQVNFNQLITFGKQMGIRRAGSIVEQIRQVIDGELNTFYILIGSNTDAQKHVPESIEQLRAFFGHSLQCSQIMESQAINSKGEIVPNGKIYSNCVLFGKTGKSLESVRTQLKKLEDRSGRNRNPGKKDTVTLDLDLVEWNQNVLRPFDVNQQYYKDCKNTL